jgi:hypothetical protein
LRAAALTQAAVHGLGGAGRTSLARPYVTRHGGDYAGVWWITAADRPGMLAGVAALAHALDPRLPCDTPPEQAPNAALDCLTMHQTPFLRTNHNTPNRLAPDRTGADVTQTVIRFVVDTRQVEAPISP